MSGPTPVDRGLLVSWPLPEPGQHKHDRGVVGVVGGSATTPGGPLLAGEAALRVGAGKVRVATSATCAPSLAVAFPEAGVAGFAEAQSGDLDHKAAEGIADYLSRADVVVAGTGLVDPDDTERLLEDLFPLLDCRLVVDGVGSAYVARHLDDLDHLAGRAVLTMNPRELSHVVDTSPEEAEADLERLTQELAASIGCVVLVGGERKVVAGPEGESSYLVTAGGPGLGVSGSGDVLAGVLGGLLARTGDPLQAAVWSAWLHASAGDVLAEGVAEVGFLARELPAVILRLLRELTTDQR